MESKKENLLCGSWTWRLSLLLYLANGHLNDAYLFFSKKKAGAKAVANKIIDPDKDLGTEYDKEKLKENYYSLIKTR